MTPTEHLLSRDPTKTVVPFGDGTNHQFHHSDMNHLQQPTGISVEEGDFLYGLVRILRPTLCVETGTNIGISASYIGTALQHNDWGHLITVEHDNTVADVAEAKLKALGLTMRVTVLRGKVKDVFGFGAEPVPQAMGNAGANLLWLDTEMDQRFGELLDFFPRMTPGAVACIHDLPRLEDGPLFGDVPSELLSLIETRQLSVMSFPTPHGVTCFQKAR